MKTVKEEKPERLLIYKDEDLHKYNRKVLDDIFVNTEQMKAQFLSLDVPFNKDTFVKSMAEGVNWIEEELYKQACELLKSKSEFVREAIINRSKFQAAILPIIPLIATITGLLSKLDISAELIAFDEKSIPFVDADLKLLLSEKSKRYATGPDEIALYGAVKKFIEAVNIFEQFLAKTSYPSVLGIPGSVERIQDFLNRYPFYDSDYFDVDIDSIKDSGCCTLLINPNLFEQLASNIKYFEDFKQHAGLSGAVTGEQELKIPVAPAVRLPRNLGKVIDGTLPPPQTKKGRWSGIGGIK